MSNYWDIPFAELYIKDGMIRMEFSNGDMVQVPEHEGITGLFRAVEDFMTLNAMNAVVKRTKELRKL